MATVMAVQVTQAAPPRLVETALAAGVGATKAAVAGMIANALGETEGVTFAPHDLVA